jgi:hypothetical protein
MNINTFKANLTGGGARANMFRVNGTFPGTAVAAAGLNPANQIQFLCRAASLPASNVPPINVYFQGRALKVPGDRTFELWTIEVYNDTNFGLRNAFEKWSDVMNRVESNVSRENLSEFAQTWSVTQLDRAGNDVKQYKFVDCWPTQIGDIKLSFDAVEGIEIFTVTLAYQYYQSEGTSS